MHFPLRGGQLQWRRVFSNKQGKEGGDDELKRRSKSPDNEEILALFRRIQSSISKERGAKVPRRRRHVIESNQYIEKGKEEGRRKGSAVEDPLSKFAGKRTSVVALPLDEQSLLKKEDEVEKSQKVNEGEEKIAGSEMQKIDDMKLSELKELARGKGIKGFSRLKKGELLQLLKEMLRASS